MLEEQQFVAPPPVAGRWTARPSTSVASRSAASDPIQIGTLLSVSGDNANLGQDSLYGVELALDYLDGTFDGKDGQIDGHDVNLQNEDDKCSSEGGQAGSTKLAANAQIVAVIGTSCSGAALGVADTTLGDKGIVLFSPSNTNPALTAAGTHNPFYFRTAHNDAIQGAVVVDFAIKQLGAKTAATIHDETPYTEGLTTVFGDKFTAAGGTVTDAEAINSADSDFKPVLTKIAQNAPDVIYLPDYTAQCALLLQQAKQIPALANTTLIGSDGCFSTDFIKLAGSAINGIVLLARRTSRRSRTADFYKNELPAGVQEAGRHRSAVGVPRARVRRRRTSWRRRSSPWPSRTATDRSRSPAGRSATRSRARPISPASSRTTPAAPPVTARRPWRSARLQVSEPADRRRHRRRQAGLLRDEDAGRRAGNQLELADARRIERCGWATRPPASLGG